MYEIRSAHEVEIVGLLTTVTKLFDRVSMHGVRRKILQAQAAAGLPLTVVMIPALCPNEIYEARVVSAMDLACRDGFKTVAFGDCFLEDIRTYRESNLAKAKMAAVFSPWQSPTSDLAVVMVTGGLRAIVVCIDPGNSTRQSCAAFATRVI